MSLSRAIKSAGKRLPGIRGIVAGRDRLQAERDELRQGYRFVPPGHFYSPIPSLDEVRRDEARIFGPPPRMPKGIAMREAEQVKLLADFLPFYETLPFNAQKTEGLRYYFENPFFGYMDAIMLHCMIRHLKPKRIVEIGSGFSSCVTLDTNELFFGNSIETTFIEPYPERLRSLVKEGDRIAIIERRLQDAGMEVFAALEPNDILFVDSTHVSKIDSDVNCIFFE